jgi:hypothetical protein
MLRVILLSYNDNLLSAILLRVIVPNVILLPVILLSVILLRALMPSVILLSCNNILLNVILLMSFCSVSR